MALSKQIGDIITEEFECGICLERLRSPRMLLCLHSFCEHCLEKYADQALDAGSLHCPTCRESTAIPNDGITGLKPDFRANKLLEALNKDENSSADLSREITVTETREVIRKCSRHDERLKFYCKTCKTCICADCTVLDHSKVDGHECVYLKEIVPEHRRDIADLVTKVDVKGNDVDSFLSKIVSVKQELDQKSSEIDQAIENEVAKIKTLLLRQSKNYIEKNRDLINDIEQRNRSTKKDVQDVAKVLHQISSSEDNFEVVEKHHSLVESVRKLTGVESDDTALDNILMRFKTLTLSCAQSSTSHYPSLNLVKQERVLEQRYVQLATSYLAVGKMKNGTLSVVCATQNQQVFCHEIPKASKQETPSLGLFSFGFQGANFANIQHRYSTSNPVCPYSILPNGQVCCVTGSKLLKGSSALGLHALQPLQQKKDSRLKDSIYQEPCMTVNMNGYVYIATEALDHLLEISPNNTVLTSESIGNICPLAITTCNTSPCETLLIATKSASVYLIDSRDDIQCIFRDREGVVWENAALTCDQEGRIYLLSSRESKISLRILSKEGNLQETIFRNRESQNPPELTRAKNQGLFGFDARCGAQPGIQFGGQGSAPLNTGFGFGNPYAQRVSTTHNPNVVFLSNGQSSQSIRQRPRLSIAVASNGDIAAVLGENELVLITLEESNIFKT